MMNLQEARQYKKATPKTLLFGGVVFPVKIRQAFLYNGELLFDCVMGNDYVLFRENELTDFSTDSIL
jgi:hypothetical protein